MPGVDANREMWGQAYAWPEEGAEWSAPWGSAHTQWRQSVLPRLQPFLTGGSVLEIAPGFGRWSSYLIPLADRYVGIDLAQSAVDACEVRFADAPHAQFRVTDGRSLPGVPDRSVDLAFSYDSLVHVEQDVIGSYLVELSRVLADDGVAFLHHSNLAACRPLGRPTQLALRTRDRLRGAEGIDWDWWRGTTVSAERFEQLARKAGLECIGQEKLNWLGPRLIDCISVVTRPGSRWSRPNVVVENPHFMAEAASARCVDSVWSSVETGRPTRADGRVRRFGPFMLGLASGSLGPFSVSVLGPWPRRREPARSAHRPLRGRRAGRPSPRRR